MYKINLRTFLASAILKSLHSLNKKNVRGRNNYLDLINSDKSVIIAVWHGHLLSVVHDLRNLRVNALAGTHDDAELISRIASNWGWNMIRGSSKEKGNIAFKKILKALKKPGSILFITPDGPTGPRRIPKPGLIRAAQLTGSYIIPVSVYSTKNWKFKNWDTFYLVKPFGEIFIEYGKPLEYNTNNKTKDCLANFIKSMERTEKNNLQYANIF